VAPVATQQGTYAANAIGARLHGRAPKPFHYRDYGMMATIGRKLAVAKIGRWSFSGFPAWVMWLVIHLMKLVRFENRLLVFVQWCYNYSSWSRSARLITEDTAELERPDYDRR
jgi:NADH dehydrogenase